MSGSSVQSSLYYLWELEDLAKKPCGKTPAIIESALIRWSFRYTDTCLPIQEQKLCSKPHLIVYCGSFYMPPHSRIGSGTPCDSWGRASVPPSRRGWRKQGTRKRIVSHNVFLGKQSHIFLL